MKVLLSLLLLLAVAAGCVAHRYEQRALSPAQRAAPVADLFKAKPARVYDPACPGGKCDLP